MTSLDQDVANPEDAAQILWMFAKTYRLEDGRFVNKVGREAPQASINLAFQAQTLLAGIQ